MRKRTILLLIFMICLVNFWPAQVVRAAVTVEDFIVSPMGSSILIEWWASDETNNTGFYLQRSQSQTAGYQRITNFIPTDWDGIQSAYYYYFDEEVIQELVYFYRLEAVDRQGFSLFYGPVPGTTNQMLPTFTPSASPIPNLTSSPTFGLPLVSATPTPSNSTPSNINALTATLLPPNLMASSPTLTGTLLAQTVLPDLTVTVLPSNTSTLEPLPTIILTFPATSTEVPKSISQKQASFPTITPTPIPEIILVDRLSTRLVSLGIIVVIIWVCLGVFLVFMVHQLRD